MRKLFFKLIQAVLLITHPKIPKKYRRFIRDNYYGRIFQIKYFFKDYFLKKKYKIIEYHGEFQQELTFVLPFAYWHFLNGTLQKTISCDDTKELYFFSDNHQELHKKRDWVNNAKNYEVPNMTHSSSFSYIKWARVPLREHYKNDILIFEKPILVIANKFNIEWGNDPLNFFGIHDLDKIMSLYKHKYQIIYNRPLATRIVSDRSAILNLGEIDWIKSNHPEVTIMDDLYIKHKSIVNNFNHFQLMVYANCKNFVSVHGGTAALASYFGGINIILSKKGLEHLFNEFSTIFPKLSEATILHARSESEVYKYLQQYY
jgi:hypothetical protein